MTVKKSRKLDSVLYDIRGPLMDRATAMEAARLQITKLNIGNLALFGFESPEEIQQAMIRNLADSAGYSDSRGIVAARQAVLDYRVSQGVTSISLDDIWLGNGASELITTAVNALLDTGDELLVPMPDFPLWTACASLAGGRAVHYVCDESNGWIPDLEDIRSKINARTKGIVVINPNNPTGVLYPTPVLEGVVKIAREFGLLILCDEVYDMMLYDGLRHTAMASLSCDVPTLTFNSLSKNHMACGYRAGWMSFSGDRRLATDYLEGLDLLANMRMCPNVPGQWAIQAALTSPHSIEKMVAPGGRLRRQRDLAYELVTSIPGVTCVKPQAALYMFPRLDPAIYPIHDDRQFFFELLNETRVLLVQGTGFNVPDNCHFRLVFLQHDDALRDSLARVAEFLDGYRRRDHKSLSMTRRSTDTTASAAADWTSLQT
ncbi:pyridoxal phosphate-dependent aminotransferase [Burkholderia anthina]|uniref:pyridoxal phosphate-dependent aminotransferase n=1 Tax=Burkholderia anthina TaxID=179879 RepID=UPI00158F5E05|nr:pyridoxal phosphate-dependent aminotransferase [Burkholderia anthina]MBY4865141.1 pyridoxal phosphate-dependent aminotransferase [Burkholderia anthina]